MLRSCRLKNLTARTGSKMSSACRYCTSSTSCNYCSYCMYSSRCTSRIRLQHLHSSSRRSLRSLYLSNRSRKNLRKNCKKMHFCSTERGLKDRDCSTCLCSANCRNCYRRSRNPCARQIRLSIRHCIRLFRRKGNICRRSRGSQGRTHCRCRSHYSLNTLFNTVLL